MQNVFFLRFAICWALLVLIFISPQKVLNFEGAVHSPGKNARPRQSLCTANEHIIFSCTLKKTGKIVSLCGSGDLTRDRGYLQYRFGTPSNIELEFPKDRQHTQQQFHYKHYFRFQVDLTEVNFEIDGYQYSVFDNYNGEEKPAQSEQGVSVTKPGSERETTYTCASKPKADYSLLAEILPQDQN